MLLRSLLSVAAAAALALPLAASTWTVTPNGAQGPNGSIQGADALWRAIDAAGPGDQILVQSGEYPAGAIGRGAHKPVGQPGAPIRVQAQGLVTIKRLSYGGATLAVQGGEWIRFEGFRFEASTSGIFFFPDWERGHQGFSFFNCEIDGMYDWVAGRSRDPGGAPSKWGVFSWGLRDFTWEGGSIHDLFYEHAMYHHNPTGNLVVKNTTIERVGRTAIQIRCAEIDGGMTGLPQGSGHFLVSGCTIRDTGLQDGGTSITLAGRNAIQTSILQNRFEYGLNEPLRAAWSARVPGHRMGSGAIVVWSEEQGWLNGPVDVLSNVILHAKGCGDRPAIQIGSTPAADVRGNRIEVGDPDLEGPFQAAIVISPRSSADPTRPDRGFADVPSVTLSANQVQGLVIVAGKVQNRALERARGAAIIHLGEPAQVRECTRRKCGTGPILHTSDTRRWPALPGGGRTSRRAPKMTEEECRDLLERSVPEDPNERHLEALGRAPRRGPARGL